MIKLSHSFSSLKMFENCPYRYYNQRILKKVTDQGGEASQYGERVHKFLEDRLGKKEALPEEVSKLEVVAARLEAAATGHDMYFEKELTLNANLEPTGWWAKDAWMRSKLDVLILRDDDAVVIDWKGLALDTRIPTPTGWTTMGDVAVGDAVFDANGVPCIVVGKSAVKNLRCFEITFDDTTKVICDEEHLWKLADGRVVNVQELLGKRGGRQRAYPPRIAVTAPLQTTAAELPIDPYVLGIWLADGKHSSGEVSKPDQFIWEEIQRRGYGVDMDTGGSGACPLRTIRGLRTQLRVNNLLCNKHIPQQYLRASFSQRIDLLRGLMDGDGSANPARKQAVYTTTDKLLSDAVCELLCSLGQRPLQSHVTAHGFGKAVAAYPVSFRPLGINPFLLPRKAARIDPLWGCGRSATRVAVAVREVPSVPTQCIAVNSTDHTFLCTDRMVPTHNTGKRRPDFTQLELFALQVFAHYPYINKVSSSFIWIKDTALDKEVYKRDQAHAMWERLLSRVGRIEQAVEHDTWPAKPSGLCNYCPCKPFCEYAR